MINFAHSEVLMIGAFIALALSGLLPPETGLPGLILLFAASMVGPGAQRAHRALRLSSDPLRVAPGP